MGYIGNAPYQGVVDSGNIVDGSIQSGDIANSAITSSKLASEVITLISQGGGPKITNIQVTSSNYTILDDTAVDTAGGYIKITGTGFATGCQVVVNNIPATSTTFVSATEVRAQVPGTAAGTYIVYLVNSDGGVAIRVNGVTFSTVPSWTTTSSLNSSVIVNIQLQASGASTFSLATGSTLPAGLTLNSSGLLSGTIAGLTQDTTYSFTVNAIDTENQDSPRTFSLAVTITVSDPYYELVTLHLPGNGTNLSNNNTFLDSSSNAFTVTRNPLTGPNAPTQGTFSPFSQTGWGNYFDGSGDYLVVASNSGITLSSSSSASENFTVECFFYPTSGGVFQSLFTKRAAGEEWNMGLFNTNVFKFGSSVADYTSGLTVTINSWNHLAVSWDGTTLRTYVNGTAGNTYTSFSLTGGSNNLAIGSGISTSSTNTPYGYIASARILKGAGAAIYTGPSITVPTAPFSVTALTTFLSMQYNRFRDASTNNATITVGGGTPSVQAFSPFNPTSSWSAATNGGSGYFDGTGDYLQINSITTTDWYTATGDFTYEGWVYPLSFSGPLYSCAIFAFATDDLMLRAMPTTAASTTVNVYGIDSAGGAAFGGSGTAAGSLRLNEWSWVVFTRESGVLNVWINGTRVINNSVYTSTQLRTTGTTVKFGSANAGTNPFWNGYQSGVKWTSGAALYSGATISVPTAPPTPTVSSGTCRLLLNFTNAGIYDATSKNDLETVGNAQISTAISAKWGSGSISFNGTTDYALGPRNVLIDLGAADFTIELWAYITSTTSKAIINLTNRTAYPGLLLKGNDTSLQLLVASGDSSWAVNLNVTGLSSVLNTWAYIAVVRSGNVFTIYRNGTSVGTATVSMTVESSLQPVIGVAIDSGGAADYFSGYMQDVRITKGYARYVTGTGGNAGQMVFNGTNDLALPTAAFPTL